MSLMRHRIRAGFSKRVMRISVSAARFEIWPICWAKIPTFLRSCFTPATACMILGGRVAFGGRNFVRFNGVRSKLCLATTTTTRFPGKVR